jgi:hypothetical protein
MGVKSVAGYSGAPVGVAVGEYVRLLGDCDGDLVGARTVGVFEGERDGECVSDVGAKHAHRIGAWMLHANGDPDASSGGADESLAEIANTVLPALDHPLQFHASFEYP